MKITDDMLLYLRGAAGHAELWRTPNADQLDAIVTALVLAITLFQHDPDGRASLERVRREIAARVAKAKGAP